jgi:Holliday junction DNA helicase RuvA
MIGWLQGTWHDGVVRTNTGVGYCVSVPYSPVAGETVELWVHTVVREDAITLWAFPNALDAAVFAALLKVQGVGPAVAMAVVRDVGPSKLAAAVAAQDPAMVRAKGVGAKTAARIIADIALPPGVTAVERSASNEIADVLARLGFDEAAALSAAKAAIEAAPDGDESSWLAAALDGVRQGGKK